MTPFDIKTKQAWKHHRDAEAKEIRRQRKLIYEPLVEPKAGQSTSIVAWCGFIILVLFLMNGCHIAHAEITEADAVRCVLGESRGEGYASMLAHSEAIRNRGTLKGVYGCRAKLDKEMPYLKAKGIYQSARRAWAESKNTSTVNGAQFWGGIAVDGKWIAKMKKHGYVQTAKVNNTVFFKKGGHL